MIGADNSRALATLYTLYRPVLDQTFTPPFLPRPEHVGAVPLVSADLASAELIKYAANAFLDLKISYINEIGVLAEKVGADITQVAKGIGLDSRIGTRFLQAVSGGADRVSARTRRRWWQRRRSTASTCRSVFEGSDAVVLATEWQQHRELPWEGLIAKMRTSMVLDGRNALDPARVRGCGAHYVRKARALESRLVVEMVA
ncbi:MAG: UDP binding domain-containing protein [Bryobacteraceae bacterium]